MQLTTHLRRGVAALAATALAVTGLTALPASAAPDGSRLIINEVYGGGGNTGATYTHDFVELYNPTSATIDVTGYTVTYYSSGGNLGNTCSLSGSVAANSHYLIQQAKGAGGTEPLPTPDAICTAPMSGTNGIVELNGPAGIVDLVGFGSAVRFEGTAAAPKLSNTPEPPPAPWLPPQQQAAPSTPSFGPGPEVLDRDALGRGRRAFDPTGWDDRPDGYEGTDFGMVGKE